MIQSDIPATETRELIKDARRAIWSFFIINVFVLLFYVIDGGYYEFVFVVLFIQALVFVVWLLPVFCYQMFVKKLNVKFAFYKAMASYKEALSHASW